MKKFVTGVFSIRICLLQIYDLTFLMPDIIAQHPEILSGCIRFFYESGSACTEWYSYAEMFLRSFFWGTYRRKNKYEAIQGLPKKAYPEFSPGRLFYCVNWQKPGSVPDPVRLPLHSCYLLSDFMEHSDAGFVGVGYISDDLHLRTGFRQVCLSAYIVERAEGQAFHKPYGCRVR